MMMLKDAPGGADFIDRCVAAVVPPAVTRLAVELASPSTLSVTFPLGGTVPAGGIPAVIVTTTVRVDAAGGVVVDGTTVIDVVLG